MVEFVACIYIVCPLHIVGAHSAADLLNTTRCGTNTAWTEINCTSSYYRASRAVHYRKKNKKQNHHVVIIWADFSASGHICTSEKIKLIMWVLVSLLPNKHVPLRLRNMICWCKQCDTFYLCQKNVASAILHWAKIQIWLCCSFVQL